MALAATMLGTSGRSELDVLGTIRQKSIEEVMVSRKANSVLSGITSALAEKATDGAWSPTIGNGDVGECPSDCRMAPQFSHPVDSQRLAASLCVRLKQSGGKCRGVTVEGGAGDPLRVSFPALQFDTDYLLELPAGTRVTNISGPTASPLHLPLHLLLLLPLLLLQPQPRHLPRPLTRALAAPTGTSSTSSGRSTTTARSTCRAR